MGFNAVKIIDDHRRMADALLMTHDDVIRAVLSSSNTKRTLPVRSHSLEGLIRHQTNLGFA